MSRFDSKKHWETAWCDRPAEETSWFQCSPKLSLDMIRNAGLQREDALIDVGGGASLLVDCLLDRDYRDLTVLDISSAAMKQARSRLGKRAETVEWIESDITQFVPQRTYALWHDRAAFHFLTDAGDRQRYVEVLYHALTPGGQAIIASFAPDGPERCSGLDIVRYDAAGLQAELGKGLVLLEQAEERHRTPAGAEQKFTYCRFGRID